MAQSKQGGAFGFLRKSIASVVYSVSTASLDGARKQIARSKPTSVRNPKTLAQIVQRMKVGPAQLFYAAFEKVAGSVENNPLSHSFQGYSYGPKNRSRFLQLAMQGDPKAYVPKGINYPVPGVYQISEGSLPSMPSGNIEAPDSDIISLDGTLSQAQVETLASMGAEVGDQLTFLGLKSDGNGGYVATFARVIIAVGNAWERVNDEDGTLDDVQFTPDGIYFSGDLLACGALILSRGTSTNSAKRSTAVMTIAPAFANLMSPEAYDAAVNSWISGISYNSLNSDWYLNQGTTQAFNGEVFTQNLTLEAGSGVDAINANWILGRQSDGGNIVYTIFTSDGTSSGTAYAKNPTGAETDVAWTAARVAAALGNVNIEYAQYSSAILAQLQGNV